MWRGRRDESRPPRRVRRRRRSPRSSSRHPPGELVELERRRRGVSSEGVVTAVRPGGATITATIDGVAGSVGVVVLDHVDLLRAPFDGGFPIRNYMDHDIPREHVDDNGVFVTFWGERVASNTDGHAGYDWVMPVGVPILAGADGTVSAVFGPGNTPTFFCPPLGRDVNDQREIQITHVTESGERDRVSIATGLS